MKKLYISLTTISARIGTVNDTIESLLKQDYPVTEITLYISKNPFLLDKGIKQIPNKLKSLLSQHKQFNIEYVENTGSYRKLLNCLKKHWNEDCLIITVDDDKIYDKYMIGQMVDKYYFYQEKSIIANRSFIKVNYKLLELCKKHFNLSDNLAKMFLKITNDKSLSNQISYNLNDEFIFIRLLTFFEGNDGVLYHPKFFTSIVFNWKLITSVGKTHDDFWFKYCTLINGYGVVGTNEFTSRPSSQIKNTNESALHFNINNGSYDRIMNNMCNWFSVNKLLEYGFRKFKFNN